MGPQSVFSGALKAQILEHQVFAFLLHNNVILGKFQVLCSDFSYRN